MIRLLRERDGAHYSDRLLDFASLQPLTIFVYTAIPL